MVCEVGRGGRSRESLSILRNQFLAVATRLPLDVIDLGVWCCIPGEEQYLLLVALSV